MKTWHRDALKILQNGVLIAFVLFQITEAFFALASYTQNENSGYFFVDFNNDQQGIMSDGAPFRSNIDVDTILGIAKITSGQPSGNFTTADIRPNSFTSWNQIILNANYSGLNDVKINVRDCDEDISLPAQGTLVPGFSNMTLSGGILDISSISAVSHPCINVEVLMTDGVVPPTVDSLRVTWNPLPGYLLTMSVPATVPAGAVLDANLNYSVSYVDDVNTVVWLPIPTTGNSTISNFNSLYGQNPVLTFVSATNGGLYTASALVVNGINVPANSIYWPLGNVNAGQSGTLNFKLQTTNGWQNNMQFLMNAHVDSVRGIQYDSDADIFTTGTQSFITSITSIPNPDIEKTVVGTAYINGQNYVTSAGGFSPLITYTVTMTDATASIGGETIFNPTITDDISDILTKLGTACSAATPSSRITPLGGGTLSGSTITWDAASGDISHIAPGASASVSYTVDYAGCPEDNVTIFNNTASGFADNSPIVTDDLSVISGVDTSPRGSFAKGDKVNGSVSISAGSDDNQFASQTYGQSFAYELYIQNIGAVAIGDNIVTDRIPDGETFQNATLPPNLNGTIFYNTSSALTAPAYSVTPGVGISGSGWTSVVPVPASSVKWIASYVPCLDSTLFPAPVGNTACHGLPASATTEVQVSIDIPSDICVDTDYLNTGNFAIYSAGTDIGNNSLSTLSTVIRADDNEPTHATPLLPSFSQSSTISGPAGVGVTQNATYTITLANTGSDASATTTVSIPTPQIDVNGAPTYLSFVAASGGTINTLGLPAQVTATLGSVPVGATRTVTITYNIPSGVVNNDNYTLNITTVATDNNNCRTVTSTLSANTSVSSRPQLQTFKNAEESVVSGGQDVHYDITFRNLGNAPTVGTYIVDRIPAKAVFKEAYTSGTNSNLVVFSCPGCKVYFSNSASLPLYLSNIQPLNGSMVSTYFTIGNEVTPGNWQPVGISPEQVTWVAWLLDDDTIATPLLPTGRVGKVGLTVTNDDDVTTLPIDNSPIGTIISNAPAIFSTDLLQAIDNQVFTTILPDPGLRIDKTSDKELLYSGEGFNWSIDYYNDSGNDDTSVILTDTMPVGTSVVNLFHTWNAKALSDGASPATEVNITTNPNVTITVNPDTTTTIAIDITGLRGGNLKNIEGGNIRIQTATNSTLLTGDVLNNFVQGCFANPSGSFCISTNDDVAIANPDLWIRKQVDITDPLAGENLNYTLIVSNESLHDAPNVLISDTLPAGLCYVGPMQVTTAGWSIGAPIISGGPCASASTTLTWSVPNGNNISNPVHTPDGTIQGNSEDIYIRYIVNVNSAVAPGTTLTNGAHIETTLTEDPVFPNDTSADVTTPLPDPYVVKTSQLIVQPGENSTFTITYGNNTRETAKDVYIIDTFPITAYPDYTNHTTPEMKFISVSGSRGETFYFHDGPLSVTAPAFNPALPTSGGWSATAGANTAFMAVAVPGDLLGQTGPYQINITFQAVNPNTNANLSAGLSLTNKSEIFSSTVDSDPLNNISTAATNTPGLDLAVTKVGSSEGGFPGVAPGTTITYDITISNQGTVDACAVKVTDTMSIDGALSAGITLVAPIHNFNTLALKDFGGNPVLPHDTSGVNINSPIGITYNGTDNEWLLGSSSTTVYTNVCMPPGTHQTFQLFAQVNNTANDSTTATNTVVVSEDSPANEDIVSNNIDQSSVAVYKADLMIDKTGFSCGPDWVCGNSDDTANTANTGETIQYNLSYDNIGNIEAENPTITETIPAGTCFRGGSITPPPGGELEYSLDGGANWLPDDWYMPGDPDCSVTHFRIVFSSPIPAPSHFDAEDALAEFGGSFNNTEALSNSIGDVVALKSSGLPTSYLSTGNPKKADINNDGLMDIVFSPSSVVSGKTTIYRNQSTSGTVSFSLGTQLTGPPSSGSQEHFEVSDLNNDNLPDITIISGDLYVYRNTSVGNNISFVRDVNQSIFTASDNTLTGEAMYYDKNINVAGYGSQDILDLNADNKQDIFIYGSKDSRACINTTSAVPGDVISFNCPTGPGSDGGLGDDTGKTYYGAVVIDDFNNDGKPDEVTGGAMSPAGIKINRNTTSVLGTIPVFTSDGPVVIGAAYYKATAYDYDGDGWKDILISSPTRILRNTTSVNGGVISFALLIGNPINGAGGYHTIANLNGDLDALNNEKMDIVTTSQAGPSSHPVFLNNSNPGTIDFMTYINLAEAVGEYPGTEPVVHDLNADGLKDIIFAGFQQIGPNYLGYNTIWRNISPDVATLDFTLDSSAILTGPMSLGPCCSPPQYHGVGHQPQIADFDKDGKDDILLNGGSITAPVVYHNDSTPSALVFTPSVTSFSAQTGTNPVALLDNFDNDINNLTDLILADDSSQSYAYTNISTPGNIKFNRSVADYFTSGDYQTLVSGVNVTSWDKLQVTQDLPAGTDIKYSFYSDPGCTAQLLPPTSAPNGYLDISAISGSFTQLCMKISFSTINPSKTPSLDAWRVTYRTFDTNSFTFQVTIKQVPGVVVINNTASISTITPEITLANNTDSYQIALNSADVQIIKSVDKVAALSDDVLTYTLNYRNNGPQEAKNVIIYDILPEPLVYTPPTSMIASNTSNGDSVSCIYDYSPSFIPAVVCSGSPLNLSPGESGSITITVQVVSSALLGDVLTNMAQITTDTLDTDLTNNQDTVTTVINNLTNMYVDKTGPASTNINSDITYTINYGNNGNVDAKLTYFVDTLDPNVTFVSATQTSGSPALTCLNAPTPDKITCSSNGTQFGGVTIAAGATGSISVTVHVANDPSLIVSNYIVHNIVDVFTISPEVTITDNHDEFDVPILPVGASSLSGTVFMDADSDVVQDILDTPISGVTIFLSGVDLYGNVFGPDKSLYPSEYNTLMAELVSNSVLSGGPYVSSGAYPSNYFPMTPKVTNVLGDYSFGGLSQGTYFVTEQDPSAYTSTGSNAGYMNTDAFGAPIYSPATDGLGSIETGSVADVDHISLIILGDGQNGREYNFGETNGTIGDLVFMDTSGAAGVFDGSDVGLGNVTINLYTDTNSNGVVDVGEPVRTTTTNSSGAYLFRNLPLNQSYIVKVTDTNNVTSAFNAVIGNLGVNNNGQNPLGYVINLSSGSPSNTTADFGYSSPTSGGTTGSSGTGSSGGTTGGTGGSCTTCDGVIGNQIFWDKDQDGVWGSGDKGLYQIEVTLYTDTNNNSVIDSGEPSASMLTNIDGEYWFSNLDTTKHYIVKVTDSTTLPAFNFQPSLAPFPGQLDDYSKDPSGYLVSTFASVIDPGTGLTFLANFTADFGFKSDEVLPETGQDRYIYGIVFGLAGAMLLIAGLRKYKII